MPGSDEAVAIALEWTTKAGNGLRLAEYLLKIKEGAADA